jgi:hypothetical protein
MNLTVSRAILSMLLKLFLYATPAMLTSLFAAHTGTGTDGGAEGAAASTAVGAENAVAIGQSMSAEAGSPSPRAVPGPIRRSTSATAGTSGAPASAGEELLVR